MSGNAKLDATGEPLREGDVVQYVADHDVGTWLDRPIGEVVDTSPDTDHVFVRFTHAWNRMGDVVERSGVASKVASSLLFRIQQDADPWVVSDPKAFTMPEERWTALRACDRNSADMWNARPARS